MRQGGGHLGTGLDVRRIDGKVLDAQGAHERRGRDAVLVADANHPAREAPQVDKPVCGGGTDCEGTGRGSQVDAQREVERLGESECSAGAVNRRLP